MKTIVSNEGLTVHWHTKNYAVVKTYGLLTGNMYQIYERVDEITWTRWPKNGINLFKTIKNAKEKIKELENDIQSP